LSQKKDLALQTSSIFNCSEATKNQNNLSATNNRLLDEISFRSNTSNISQPRTVISQATSMFGGAND